MECSSSDATFFEYFKGEGPKPSRTQEGMILSASEWTGVPLAAVLNDTDALDGTDRRRRSEILAFTTNLEHAGDIVEKSLMRSARLVGFSHAADSTPLNKARLACDGRNRRHRRSCQSRVCGRPRSLPTSGHPRAGRRCLPSIG